MLTPLQLADAALCLENDRAYQLNYPLDDMIVFGWHLDSLKCVSWNVLDQRWD